MAHFDLPKRFLLLILAGFSGFFSLSATAQDGVDAAADAESARAEVYHPQTVSIFQGNPAGRNPFWPIGWKPSQGAPATEKAPAVTFNPNEQLKISSTMMGEVPLAIINGKSYAKGELVPVQLGDRDLLVTVVNVRDREVDFSLQGQQFTVQQRSRF